MAKRRSTSAALLTHVGRGSGHVALAQSRLVAATFDRLTPVPSPPPSKKEATEAPDIISSTSRCMNSPLPPFFVFFLQR
jgi:hypothetical protein